MVYGELMSRPGGKETTSSTALRASLYELLQDEMHVQVARYFCIDPVQEPTKLRGAMAAMHFTDHLASRHIQCGEQGRGAVALVVVGATLDLTGPHRQDRLCPIEGLDLALLVCAQHQRPFGRVEVQADDIAHLLNQLRVGRQLEVSARCG